MVINEVRGEQLLDLSLLGVIEVFLKQTLHNLFVLCGGHNRPPITRIKIWMVLFGCRLRKLASLAPGRFGGEFIGPKGVRYGWTFSLRWCCRPLPPQFRHVLAYGYRWPYPRSSEPALASAEEKAYRFHRCPEHYCVSARPRAICRTSPYKKLGVLNP